MIELSSQLTRILSQDFLLEDEKPKMICFTINSIGQSEFELQNLYFIFSIPIQDFGQIGLETVGAICHQSFQSSDRHRQGGNLLVVKELLVNQPRRKHA